MEPLIDEKHMQQLTATLQEAGDMDFIHRLYTSVSESFNELMDDRAVFFDPNTSEEQARGLHLLRNRYRNLGMMRCSRIARNLENLVLKEERDHPSEEKALESLKNTTHSTLNLFFTDFLP